MPFAIHERDLRMGLEVRPKPYFVRLTDGVHLGYRRGKTVSRWVVRTRCNGTYRTATLQGVEPDDARAADGQRVLSFQQVVSQIMTDSNAKLACSFCGKDRDEVAQLVAGPNVFICNNCVALCQLYLDHPTESGKLLVEDGEPVMEDGQPVFVDLTEEEQQFREELLRR